MLSFPLPEALSRGPMTRKTLGNRQRQVSVGSIGHRPKLEADAMPTHHSILDTQRTLLGPCRALLDLPSKCTVFLAVMQMCSWVNAKLPPCSETLHLPVRPF